MKKTFYILFVLIASLINGMAQAQVYQLPNGGFENWDGSNSADEPTNWNSFPSAECTLFLGCGTATATRHSKSTDTRPGTSGNYSIKIFATSALGLIANGNITTGQIHIGSTTATNPDNYNITKISDSPYRQALNAKPDSIVFWAKFVCPSSSQKARVSATIHNNYSYRDPETGDANSPSHVVGKAIYNFTRGDQTWVRYSVPFDYDYPATTPEYILLTFTTNMVAGEGSTSDALYVDDVEFIYNAKLSGITVNGITISNFSPSVYDYHIELDCGLDNNVAAMAQSENAEITVTQTTGTNPAIISVSNGDQVVTYRVYFQYLNNTYISDEICAGNTYNENGFNIPIQENPGIYNFSTILYQSETCDSIINLNLTVHPSIISEPLDVMICENAEYIFFGQTLTEPGIYDTLLISSFGCDSLITLNLSVGEYYRTFINASICEGDSYSEHGFSMNTPGSDTIIYIAQNNCDSLVILNLMLNPIYEINLSDTITVGSTYSLNGFDIPAQQETGRFLFEIELSSFFGCDSLIELTLFVKSQPVDTTPEPGGDFSFSIYPVPASETVTLISESDVNIDLDYVVFDMFGRRTLCGKILNTDTIIDISKLASGIYFIKITYPIEKTLIYKFIIN